MNAKQSVEVGPHLDGPDSVKVPSWSTITTLPTRYRLTAVNRYWPPAGGSPYGGEPIIVSPTAATVTGGPDAPTIAGAARSGTRTRNGWSW